MVHCYTPAFKMQNSIHVSRIATVSEFAHMGQMPFSTRVQIWWILTREVALLSNSKPVWQSLRLQASSYTFNVDAQNFAVLFCRDWGLTPTSAPIHYNDVVNMDTFSVFLSPDTWATQGLLKFWSLLMCTDTSREAPLCCPLFSHILSWYLNIHALLIMWFESLIRYIVGTHYNWKISYSTVSNCFLQH